jgi:hypothetical protein
VHRRSPVQCATANLPAAMRKTGSPAADGFGRRGLRCTRSPILGSGYPK